jgi:hypothetical protein
MTSIREYLRFPSKAPYAWLVNLVILYTGLIVFRLYTNDLIYNAETTCKIINGWPTEVYVHSWINLINTYQSTFIYIFLFLIFVQPLYNILSILTGKTKLTGAVAIRLFVGIVILIGLYIALNIWASFVGVDMGRGIHIPTCALMY